MKYICPYPYKQQECECGHAVEHQLGNCINARWGCPDCVPVKEEEKKMKCRCGYEGMTDLDNTCPLCGSNHIIKPKPSPRDIFAHIKTECERKAFDEFMEWHDNLGSFHVQWDCSLHPYTLERMQKDRPDWWQWLQSRGLIEKKKVKKQAWRYIYRVAGGIEVGGSSYPTEEQAERIGRSVYSSRFIKTILLHEWDESE